MQRPTDRLDRAPVTLVRWRAGDAAVVHRLVEPSLPHLRPWMPWAAAEYDLASAEAYVARAELDWASGAAFNYAITVAGEPVGSCALMARIGPGGLELGYWLHPAQTGRGYVTAAAAALVEAAFALPGTERVEIVHDEANTASGAVPRRLDFVLLERRPAAEPVTSAETGVDVVWRLTRQRYAAR
jgi:RimJ/RimL family protein N-acetyltransferase